MGKSLERAPCPIDFKKNIVFALNRIRFFPYLLTINLSEPF